MASTSRLWSGLAGTRAAPVSPPRSRPSRESSRKLPLAFSPLWHSWQRHEQRADLLLEEFQVGRRSGHVYAVRVGFRGRCLFGGNGDGASGEQKCGRQDHRQPNPAPTFGGLCGRLKRLDPVTGRGGNAMAGSASVAADRNSSRPTDQLDYIAAGRQGKENARRRMAFRLA